MFTREREAHANRGLPGVRTHHSHSLQVPMALSHSLEFISWQAPFTDPILGVHQIIYRVRPACDALLDPPRCAFRLLSALLRSHARSLMACSVPDGTRWHVVYSKPPSKRKDDGILTLRYLNGNVVKKLLLFDHCGSTLLADRFLKKFEDVLVGDALAFDNGFVLSVDALAESLTGPSPHSSTLVPLPRSVTLTSSLGLPSIPHLFRVDQASVANVGSRWDVLYTRHPNKKLKKTHEGVLLLSQKTELQQKVDQQFLSGSEDISCGKTLQFEHVSVEVMAIKEDTASSAEVRIIQDMPADHMRLHWQRTGAPFQGSQASINHVPGLMGVTAASRAGLAADECGDREGRQVCYRSKQLSTQLLSGGDCGLEWIQNSSGVSVQPKRRNSGQILNSLKRPTDLPGITNSCSRKQPEREDMSMLSSTSRPPLEEERSASLDCVDLIQELNVDKACPEESADDFIYVEHDVVQQQHELGDSRDSIIYNPGDQFSASSEQNEIAAKKVHIKASPHMKIGRLKCSMKGGIKPFKSPQINVALVATQGLPNKDVSLDFQVDAPLILRRKVMIPDEFSSLASYQSIMSSAIIEELNLILHDLAKRFGRAKNELSRVPGSAQLRRLSPLSGVSSGDEMEQRYDRCNLEFYSDCELFMRSKKTWGELVGKDTVHQTASVSENRSVLLKLGRVKRYVKYSRHDIWVISSNPNFCKIRSDDFLAVAVSKWHGTPTEGIFELEFLGQNPRQQKGLFALHDRGVSTELMMLDVVRSLNPSRVPLLPLLLCPKQSVGPNIHQASDGEGFTLCEEDLKAIVRRHINCTLRKFQLNSDQAKVLLIVSEWFLSNGSESAKVKLQQPELCLVHGTFGSGKSFLLVVLIIFITDLLKVVNDTTSKILVSAATNIAVDRILLGLLEHDFTDFIRVGSLESISKSILPYSLHTITQSRGDTEKIQELQQLVNRANPSSRRVLEEELQNMKEGKIAKRREKLKTMRVVGVTCHSCPNPVLEGQKFTICILDECSQMPEPLSLLPLTGCSKLIAVGDPAQLPPTLSHVHAEWEDELSNTPQKETLDDIHTQSLKYGRDGEPRKIQPDLRRALFVRLAKVYEPILLRTQYRCHPRLTAVANILFYGEKLVNGCREVDRPALTQGLPPLLFCDTGRKGVEQKDGLGFKNEYEAKVTSQIVTYLVSQGVPELQIGVIVFYKSQAALVQRTLCQDFSRGSAPLSNTSKTSLENGGFVEVQVSTVDAFQGMEKNIILLSCCRTNGLGFLASSNRLNVALTRARHHLIIIGKAENIQNNINWKKLLSSVRSSPGSYRLAQEFVGNLSANREGGSDANSNLGAVGVDRENCKMQQEDYSMLDKEIDREASSERRSSPVKSAALVDKYLCFDEVKDFLDDLHFRIQDFWVGFKLYCFGHYSRCNFSREQFLASKMGRVVLLLQKEKVVLWGAKFDETVRQVWVTMEEYIRIRYDEDCTNFRALMEEFEDETELSTSENGSFLLQLVKDDKQGTERLYKQARSVQVQSTDIFDQFRRRLNRVDSNLGNLLKSSWLKE